MALTAAAIVGVTVRRKPAPAPRPPAARPASALLAPDTRFLNAEPEPGAIQQIESLLKADSFHDAALLDAMVATPSAIWLMTGAPQQVENDVREIVTRGARQGRVPVLVPYHHPFHECTGYGASGAADTAVYKAWLDGVVAGIGNERAVVILEPNSLGLVPYGKRLDGTEDSCRPTIADKDGKRAPPPGATAAERYRELNDGVDTLALRAPNAAVYLDGTHSSWLPVGEAAYRLRTAGVDRAAGFFLNVGNYQPTRRLIQYGTWVAKCLEHARAPAPASDPTRPYRECATPPEWADPDNDGIWASVDAWYAAHVDPSLAEPSNRARLTHFVINTNRNGRGPLAVARYAGPPYNQPAVVLEALRNGSWCMPPDRGLGLRPTANTGVPLVDAYLWTDRPGISVASCDIAGGARAWDYSKYNPWGLSGDAQEHFDPLWGMILPPTGAWFPAEALGLAHNATPSLEEGPRAVVAGRAQALAAQSPASQPDTTGRPAGHSGGAEVSGGHPASAPAPGSRPSRRQPPSPQFSKRRDTDAHATGAPAFDPANPYR
jgi:endoglucanase